MRILKANTAVRLVVGPLCDKTTGLAKTGMTVTNMAMNMWHEHDDGSAPTKSIDAVSFTASAGNNDMVELAGGYYDIEITAAQLNITAGRCGFLIYDDDVILPYFEEWLVVPANVFDSIMGTDKLDVNAAELGGTSQTGNDVGADVNDILADTGTDGVIVASIANDAITAAAIKTDAVAEIADGVLDEAMAGHVGAGTLGKAIADTLEDTGTTIPADLVDIENKIDVIGVDTTTEIPATLVTIDNLVDDLETRLTAARAGYLDNLSAGAVALEATLTAIKGAGWTTETLAAIKVVVDAISSGALNAAGVRTAIGLATANLDTQLAGVAKTGGDGDTLETISDQIDLIDVSGVADAVLDELMAGHAIAGSLGKLLTDLPDDVYDLLAAIPAVSLASPTAGDTLELYAGDSIEFNVTGLGDLTDVDEIYFTMKKDMDDADSAAIWQVSLTGGLLYLNGAAATVPANSSITVVDLAGGEIQVRLKAVESIEIPCRNYQYDVKTMTDPDTALSKTQGDVEFKPVVTKAIT